MKPFFIVGCPRSGTTLLQVALNRHSRILIPPETKLFYYFHGMPGWLRRRHLARLNRDLRVELPASLAGREVDSRTVYVQLVDAYRRRTGKSGATHFGEKTPEHTARIASIRQVFPEAPILFVYRDGRDVAASLTRVPWIQCNHLSAGAVWLWYFAYYVRWRKANDPHIHFVRYEELVANPEIVFTALLERLGLDPEPAVYDAEGDVVGAIPERERGWKSEAAKPITVAHMQKWRQALSAAEVADLEAFCGPALAELGYPLVKAHRPPTWSQRARLGAAVVRAIASLPKECLVAEATALFRPRRRGVPGASGEVHPRDFSTLPEYSERETGTERADGAVELAHHTWHQPWSRVSKGT